MLGLDFSTVRTSAEGPEFKLGTVMSDNGVNGPCKKYKYVKYDAATAAAAGVTGEVAYYLAANAAGSIVTSDLSDSNEIGAGVIQNTMADNSYGWLQISGPATLSIALSAETDGAALTPAGSADGTLDVSAAATDHICAVADDASAKLIMCMFPE